jgi:conjugative relaxase-like TrwC/TraI family protein
VWVVGVVMRVTTLKAAGGRLQGLLAYYAGLADDRQAPDAPARGPVDYYLDPGEPPGRWWGAGRHALGLEGSVAGGDLRALLDAHHPGSGARLGRQFGDTSARGFDATFSAPKSVSVLWALSPDPWVRAEVLAAHDAAVTAALGWFERHGAVTRRGTDGVFQVDTAGVTAALFRQHTSRAMDPQLHTHAVIASKVQDRTGRWLALDARFLKFQQRSIGAVYDAALRCELTGRLGARWIEREPGLFDLACIPTGVRDGFSKRSAQVDAKVTELIRRWSDENDGADPDPRTIARLERTASLASRPGKEHGVDAAVLRAEWAREAAGLGFDPAALTPARIADEHRLPVAAATDGELINAALSRVSEEASSWLRADLVRHLAVLLDTGAPPDAAALTREADRLAILAEARCTLLGPAHRSTTERRADGRPVTEHVTDRCLTTPAVLDEEHRLQAWAAANTPPVTAAGDPQRAAAEAIAGHGRLVLVVGPAGTGKTHTTARAVEQLRTQNCPVVGLAPSGKAADVLATAAVCPTDTVAGFLTRHHRVPSPWPPGTTVILDEAGMAATADLARLVDLVEVNQWRLIAVGDPEQLPSAARGGVFAHWCDTVPHHTLDEPRRFSEPWEAAASLALRAGRPDAADAYAAHGRLHTAHPATIPIRVARAHQRHTDAGRTTAITTSTAETAKAINEEIQWQRHPTGPSTRLHDRTQVFTGDQITTRRNHPTLTTSNGERIRNRHTWTVTAVHRDGSLTIEHPQRGHADLPADYVAAHVELGWAVTGYGTQGDTVDIGIAVLDTAANRNHAYVAMTRGRHANHALLTDPTGTADPAEHLNQIITRPNSSESALATQLRLHHNADTEPPTPGPVNPSASGFPEGTSPAPEQQPETMRRRLDSLQHQTPNSDSPSLGL